MFKTKTISTLSALYCLMHLVLADFPIDPQPCRFKDTKCFIEHFNYFLSEKYSGDKSINLVEFDPLRVSLVRIKKDPHSPINIDLRLKNNVITGLKDAKLVKATDFGPDMTLSHELVFKVKQFHMMGEYSVKGRVVILPVTGSGDHDLTANDVTFTVRFNGTPQQRNGVTYMTIENMTGTINAKRVTYKFNNLFNGDKALSDNVNLFINDNWRDIWDEIRGNLIEGLQPTIQKVFNDVFATMPYSEFFAKE